jgi:hypothetical protein
MLMGFLTLNPSLCFVVKKALVMHNAKQSSRNTPKAFMLSLTRKYVQITRTLRLKQWVCQQYKWGSAYSPSDNEPRLLVLDAFGAHKKSTQKAK